MEKILFSIQQHLILVDDLNQSTKRLKKFAKENDIENISFESKNRQRIINILVETQNKIERLLGAINTRISIEHMDVIRTWKLEYNKISESVQKEEEEIIRLIEQSKKNLSKEIASVFAKKERFKGYNLGNVKK